MLREEAIVGAYSLKALVQRTREDLEGAIATLEGRRAERGEDRADLPDGAVLSRRGSHGRRESDDPPCDEVAPDDVGAQLVLSTYLGTGRFALVAARAAVEVAPDDATNLRVAELLIDIGFRDGDETQIEEGRKIVDSILEERPDSPEANFVKAKIELADGDVEAAKASLETTLQARPDWAQARFVLGSTLAASGDLSRARVELEAALEEEPGLLDARKLLTTVYATLGEHEFVIERAAISRTGPTTCRSGSRSVRA